jgi:hypothetical protein
MYNGPSKPAIRYGSETWVLGAQNNQRIETFQMTFLRSILGITVKNKIRSEEIRKRLQVGNLVADIYIYIYIK